MNELADGLMLASIRPAGVHECFLLQRGVNAYRMADGYSCSPSAISWWPTLNRASKPASRSRPSPDTTNRLRRGELVYANKQALRIGAVVLASLALVFWSQPTGKVVLLLAGLLLVALALIELLGRPPSAPSSPPNPDVTRAAALRHLSTSTIAVLAERVMRWPR